MYNADILANAIVAQAARDYRRALCEQHEEERHPEGEGYRKWTSVVNDLERFFTGDYIRMLTKLDGSALMKRIEKEAIEYDYNLRAIYDSHKEEFEGDP